MTAGESAVAAQEHLAGNLQAILRLHHDTWNMSIAMASRGAAGSGGDPAWWRKTDTLWSELVAEPAAHLLGEARLYLALVEPDPGMWLADPRLVDSLVDLLPEDADLGHPMRHGVALADGVVLWEIGSRQDDRSLRRFLLAVRPDADPLASAWVWSRGDSAIPPLARYLLHAAKLRYQLRVWQRDDQSRDIREALESLEAHLRGPAEAEAAAQLIKLRRSDAMLFTLDLRAMRHAVVALADNLDRAVDRRGLLSAGGPFADDAEVARSLLERLDDQIASLGLTTDRVTGILDRPAAAHAPTAPRASAAPQRRDSKVFVVHGRDEPARVAVCELLAALGLDPIDWDESVAATGEPMPFLGQVLLRSVPMAQAVVAVMTPDDIVRLHPELHGMSEPGFETRAAMQARPNVLIELGMALAIHPRATLILALGDLRPIADLGGFNYVRIGKGVDFRRRIGLRLKLAGCQVHMPEDGAWQRAGGFEALTAYQRMPAALDVDVPLSEGSPPWPRSD